MRRGSLAVSGSFSLRLGAIDERGGFGERTLGVAAGLGARVDGGLGRVLGALAAVERLRQRQAIVPCGNGDVSLGQRVDGALQLVGGVLVRAGGFGSIDGALRLVHFLAGRLGAAGGEQQRDDETRAARSMRS